MPITKMAVGVHVDSAPSSLCRFQVLNTGWDILWDDWRASMAQGERWKHLNNVRGICRQGSIPQVQMRLYSGVADEDISCDTIPKS